MRRSVALLAFLCATTHAAVFTEGGQISNGQNSDVYSDLGEDPIDQLGYFERPDFLNRQLPNNYEEPIELQQQDDGEYMQAILEEIGRIQQQQPGLFENKEGFAETYDDVFADSARGADLKKPAAAPLAESKPKVAEPKASAPVKAKAPVVPQAPAKIPQKLTTPSPELIKQLNEELRRAEEELEIELKKENDLAAETREKEPVAAGGDPLVPQKKGQNEFVSFIEPVEGLKQTKSVQTMDKRRLATAAEYSSNVPRYNSSSLLLIAVGTVLSVGLVGTVVGGYYYKRRTETPDDGEYAPYAGTGPGFKRTKGAQGDETLAYKAQLHQYQQAKQKIICGEDAPAVIESDGEEDGNEEENNFSVYECPGLAPTGDIEVCNPNFAAHP